MVKKLFSYLYPVEWAAIIIIFLLLTTIVQPVDRNLYQCLLLPDKTTEITGWVAGNPVKTSSGFYYKVPCSVSYAKGKDGSTFSAKGLVQLLVKANEVEALYPGKLYSASKEKENLLLEQGALIQASVSYLPPQKIDSLNQPFFIVSKSSQSGWKNTGSKIRALMRLSFKRLLFNWGDCGGLLLALLSGSGEYTNSQVSENFKNAGLAHILALSGMHLSLFAGVATFIGKNTGGKKIGKVFSLVAVSLFVWFAGLSPSLCRAYICSLLSLLLSCVFIRTRLTALLAISFLIQMCLFPQDWYSAAFLLSYSALVGLSVAQQYIYPQIRRIMPSRIASSLSASTGAQICTTPITLSLFGTFTPVGIIASVIVSPIANYFLIFGITSIALSLLFPFLLVPLGFVMNWFYKVLVFFVALFT